MPQSKYRTLQPAASDMPAQLLALAHHAPTSRFIERRLSSLISIFLQLMMTHLFTFGKSNSRELFCLCPAAIKLWLSAF